MHYHIVKMLVDRVRLLWIAAIAMNFATYTIAGGPPENLSQLIERNIGFDVANASTVACVRATIHSRSESSREVPNRHVPGQVDHIVSLTDGAGVKVVASVNPDGRAFVQQATITSRSLKLPLGFQIGQTSLDDVHRTLGRGEQIERAGAAIAEQYSGGIGYEVIVLVWFDARQHLAGIEWQFPLD